ncbi:MAG: hypothetical protein NW241_09985 [Bacteroidia bacterium]|nr:hypothetical protein [Bacteroidia bacterium]
MASPVRSQWTASPFPLPAGQLHDVMASPPSWASQPQIFIAADKGLYRSSDQGATWIKVPAATEVNPFHQAVFQRTRFTHLSSGGLYVYAGGIDTVAGQYVVFHRTNANAFKFSLLFTGPPGVQYRDLVGSTAFGDSGYVNSTQPFYPAKPMLRSGSYLDCPGFRFVVAPNLVAVSTSCISSTFTVQNSSEQFEGVAMVYTTQGHRLVAYGPQGLALSVTSGSLWSPIPFYGPPVAGRNISYLPSTDKLYYCTSDGIYVADTVLHIFERMTGSAGYSVKHAAIVPGGTSVAICDQGILLKTTQAFGPVMPAAAFTMPEQICLGASAAAVVTGNPQYSYTWLLNGAAAGSGLQFTPAVSAPGIYTIQLIADNGASTDTLTRTLTVHTPPPPAQAAILGLPLCEPGSVQIQLTGTQAGLSYALYRQPGQVLLGTSSGGAGLFQSGMIADSAVFQVRTTDPQTQCSAWAPQAPQVRVEHVDARFQMEWLNALAQEPVLPLNGSSGFIAAYAWDFGPSASTPFSTAAHPAAVSFPNTGLQTVTLTATSPDGCSDTAVWTGPQVVSLPPSNPFNWALGFPGSADGIYGPDYSHDLVQGADGDLYVAGGYGSTQFRSRAGRSSSLDSIAGGFLARYSEAGMLRWLVYTTDTVNANEQTGQPVFTSVALDPAGQIYLAGLIADSAVFTDNTGRRTRLASTPMTAARGVLIKLDPKGRLQWHVELLHLEPIETETDAAGYVYLLAGAPFNWSILQADGTLYQPSNPPSGMARHVLLKISPAGSVLWHAWQYSASGYYTQFHDLHAHGGKLYLSGQAGGDLYLTSADGTADSVLIGGLVPDGLLLQYDTAGVVNWNLRMNSITDDPVFTQSFDHFYQIGTDAAGNLYVSGQADGVLSIDSASAVVFTTSSGGSDTLHARGPVVVSYDPQGAFRWANGASGNIVMSGAALAVTPAGDVFTAGERGFSAGPIGAEFTSTSGVSILDSSQCTACLAMLKYDAYGVLEWFATEQGPFTDNQAAGFSVHGIAAHPNGALSVSGKISLTTGAPDAVFGPDTLHGIVNDVYLARVHPGSGGPRGIIRARVLNQEAELCGGDTLRLDVSMIEGISQAPGNLFSLELTDTLGSFRHPQILGSWPGTQLSDTLQVPIPYELPPFSGYRLRMIASDPPRVSYGQTQAMQYLEPGISADAAFCPDVPVTVSASAGLGYQWMPAAEVSDPAAQTVLFTGSLPAALLARVQLACGVQVDTFRIRRHETGSITAPKASPQICLGDSITLEAAGGTSYSWTTGSGTGSWTGSTISVAPSGPESYVVSIFNSETSCLTTDTVQVAVLPLPSGEIEVQDSLLTAPAGYIYQWYLDGQPIPGARGPSYAPEASGSYQVLLTDTAGCAFLTGAAAFIRTDLAPQAGISCTLYPNPAVQSMRLRFSAAAAGALHIRISSLDGRTVSEWRSAGSLPAGEHDLELIPPGSTLPAGLYWVQITAGTSRFAALASWRTE